MKATELLHTPQITTREQQLRDITTAGNEDAAECAASDAFKEFPSQEGR